MTSATSPSNCSLRRGFTLTELLVVIGIIVVLAGILLPSIIKAYSAADKSKSSYDLQSISVALEAYKSDMGDYPRIDRSLNRSGESTGAAVLCKALIGPSGLLSGTPPLDARATTYVSGNDYVVGDYVSNGTATYLCIATASNDTDLTVVTKWTPYSMADGKDGFGFRVRNPGPTYGPYLNMDKGFKVRGAVITDRNDAPILYYPSNPSANSAAIYVTTTIGGYVNTYVANQPSVWCSTDNLGSMPTNSLKALLGDYGLNGRIDTVNAQVTPNFSYVEKSVGNFPFLLISAGPDGTFGPGTLSTVNSVATLPNWYKNKDLVRQCDDITNFPR